MDSLEGCRAHRLSRRGWGPSSEPLKPGGKNQSQQDGLVKTPHCRWAQDAVGALTTTAPGEPSPVTRTDSARSSPLASGQGRGGCHWWAESGAHPPWSALTVEGGGLRRPRKAFQVLVTKQNGILGPYEPRTGSANYGPWAESSPKPVFV